jgi:hypothetical protein
MTGADRATSHRLIVMVTGAGPGLGKSTLAARLREAVALFPYLTSLLAWGHDDATIRGVFDGLFAAMAPSRVVQLHLTGGLADGVARAAAREGDGWLEQSITKTNSYPGCDMSITSVDDLVAYLTHTSRQQAGLLACAP